MNRRRLTIVLWTALALIGLQLASGKAQAHQGHAHPVFAVHHAAAQAHDADGQRQPSPPAIATTTSFPSEMSAARADDPSDDGAAPCNGACCAASSCCGSAMAAIPAAFGPPSLRGLMVAIRAGPTGLGLDPEALPKPPKSFV